MKKINDLGTYDYCTNCNLINNCCNNFKIIDSPILSLDEKNIIENIIENKIGKSNIFECIESNCYLIKTKNKCPFYKNKCIIYE